MEYVLNAPRVFDESHGPSSNVWFDGSLRDCHGSTYSWNILSCVGGSDSMLFSQADLVNFSGVNE